MGRFIAASPKADTIIHKEVWVVQPGIVMAMSSVISAFTHYQ